MATIEPGMHRILVKPLERSDPAYGAPTKLVIPDVEGSSKEDHQSTIFRVVAVGEGVTRYVAGDLVFRESGYPAPAILYDSIKLVVLTEPAIVGKLILDIDQSKVN